MVVVVIENLEAADRADIVRVEPLLNTVLHEEVLETAWQDDDVLGHTRVYVT